MYRLPISSRWMLCSGWLAIAALLATPCLAEESNATRTAGRLAGVVSPGGSSPTEIDLAGEPSGASLAYAQNLGFEWTATDEQPLTLESSAARQNEVAGSQSRQPGRSNLNLLPGEPAQEILELIERAGGSVLEGTLFNVPSSNESFADNREARRATIVETVRQLQNEDETRLAELPPATWPTSPSPLLAPRATAAVPAAVSATAECANRDSVEELRRACEQLELAAGALERQELYDYADRLRATAQEMRLEARRLTREKQSQPGLPTSSLELVPALGAAGSFQSRLAPQRVWPAAVGYRTRRNETIDPRDNEIRALKSQLEALEEQLRTRPVATPISVPLRYPLEPETEDSSNGAQGEVIFGGLVR